MADIKKESLRPAKTPSLDEHNFPDDDFVDKGKLAPVAASVLMKIVYTARCQRFDLLFPVCVLAREVTRWTRACDKQLHRLVCYVLGTLEWNLEAFIGDPVQYLSIVLYSDADFAGDLKDSKSTSGAVVALVGPNSCVPVSAWCKKQGCVSHSSTEAEIVSLDASLHQEGLPVLTFWEEMVKLFGPKRTATAGHTAPIVPFVVRREITNHLST